MKDININPFGNNGELPAGYPIADDLITNSAQQSLSARQGKKLNDKLNSVTCGTIVVAASNTPSSIKEGADYICTGENDEVTLNLAIDSAISKGCGILLLRGDYYLDSPIKTYASSNDTFLLIDTSPPSGSTTSRSLTIEGENPAKEISANIHLGNSAYESLNGTKQYSLLAVKDSTQYGGFVEIKNMKLYLPSNQKKVCALDMVDFGGYARLHSLYAYAYTNGYNGQNITISNPPAVAVEGCIGIKFIGKGPNGSYGSEITDCNVFGFNEGICINTEWTVCNHVCSIFCVTGWVFGKYTTSQIHSSTHPIVLINCGDERCVTLPYFHTTSGMQDIEMIAFSIERNAANTPGGVLGNLAMERVPGSFRGRITYCTGQGSGNWTNGGFWEYGHGHGFVSVDTSHLPGGTTSQRSNYHHNYLQRYYDTTIGKEIICVDETNNVWKDTMGNVVSNS